MIDVSFNFINFAIKHHKNYIKLLTRDKTDKQTAN